MNEMFEKECEELGILFEEFPYDFAEGGRIDFPALAAAMMWILKKRQDKMQESHYNSRGF
jgi:hypothetical protein